MQVIVKNTSCICKSSLIKIWTLITMTLLMMLLYLSPRTLNATMKAYWSNDNSINNIVKIFKSTSNCYCHQNETISVESVDANYYGVYLRKNETNTRHLYNISKSEYTRLTFTCGTFSTLRRGPHQNVISYTLFGKNKFFYDKLHYLTRTIAHMYPGWLMRVYHDASINTSIVCDIECATTTTNNNNSLLFIDNSDFCDLSNFTVDNNNYGKEAVLRPPVVEYVLPRIWRFFAIGDSFVDVFASRDSDSFISQRELDSVNVWLGSYKSGHIMRDHWQHGTLILAGMWGFKSQMNRNLANRIYKLAVDPAVMKRLDPNKVKPKRKIEFFYIYIILHERLKYMILDLIKQKGYIRDTFIRSVYFIALFVLFEEQNKNSNSLYPC